MDPANVLHWAHIEPANHPDGSVSVWDHFAAAALTGLMQSNAQAAEVATWAANAADAMVRERLKRMEAARAAFSSEPA